MSDSAISPGGYGRHWTPRRLVRALVDVAVARGYRRMDFSVLDWNAPAIAFYASLGARPQAEWTTFRLDAAALAALAGPPH